MPTVLYIAGSISLVIGVMGIFALVSDGSMADFNIAASCLLGGVLLLGFAYALRKLADIEQHLNPNKITPEK